MCRRLPFVWVFVALVGLISVPALAQDRIALVVGNDRYPNLGENQQLAKAVNDARAVGDALEKLGFSVLRGENLDRQGMVDRLFAFTQKIKPGDMAVLFFAGHGVAISGANYLLPSDARPALPGEEARVRNMAISEADILADIQERKARVAVLVLDACRDNPFRLPGALRSVGTDRGLLRAREAEGVFAIYSAGFGQSALDRLGPNDPSQNSVFTRLLVPALARTDAHLADIVIDLREEVARLAATIGHQQFPAYYDQTRGGRVYLMARGTAAPPAPLLPTRDPLAEMRTRWAGWSLSPQIGHVLPVNALAVTPDGRQIVSASIDMTIKIWEAETGWLINTIDAPAPLTALAVSPDGANVLAAGVDRSLHLFDLHTGRPLGKLTGHASPALAVAFSQDGRFIVSGDGSGEIRMWDRARGEFIRKFEAYGGPVFSLAVMPDGWRVVSAGGDSAVKVWDSSNGKLVKTLEGHAGAVIALALSPDGRRVVSASLDKTVKVWDGGTLQFIRTLGTHAGSAVSVAFSRNGRTIVSGGLDGSIKVWDAVTMQPARTLGAHLGRPAPLGPFASGILSGLGTFDYSGAVSEAASWILSGGVPGVLALAFLPDGRFVSAGGDRSIKLWEAATAQPVRTNEGHADVMASLAFSPDGRRIASASADSTIRIWDASTLRLVHSLQGHADAVTSVAWSPDGRRLASGSLDRTVRLWSVDSGQAEATLEGHADAVASVAFSPDGRSIASGGLDRLIHLWDVRSQRLVRTFEGHTLAVMSVAFAPDGLHIASGSLDAHISIWSIATGEAVKVFSEELEPVLSLTFARERWLAAGTVGRDIRVFDLNAPGGRGEKMSVPRNGTPPEADIIMSVAFSADGRRLVTAGADRLIRVWQTQQSGTAPLTLTGHRSFVSSVALSPDGRRIASVGFSDKTLRMWDAQSGRLLSTVIAFGASDYVALAADGQFSASAGAAEHMRLIRGLDIVPVSDDYKAAFMRERSLDEIAAAVR